MRVRVRAKLTIQTDDADAEDIATERDAEWKGKRVRMTEAERTYTALAQMREDRRRRENLRLSARRVRSIRHIRVAFSSAAG